MALGWQHLKQVKLLRANSSASPTTLHETRAAFVASDRFLLSCSLGLAYNSTIVEIHLSHIQMDSMSAKALFQALRNHKTVVVLNVAHNRIGDASIYALAATLYVNTSLTQLSLGHNEMTSKGVKVLCQALQENQDSSLIHLDLSYNPLHEASTAALADCLSVNETLTTLNLSGSQVDEIGILTALWRNTTLHVLNLQPRLECHTLSNVAHTKHNNQLADPSIIKDRLNRSHGPALIQTLRKATSGFSWCNLTGVFLHITKLKSSRWVKYPHASLNELDGLVISVHHLKHIQSNILCFLLRRRRR